MALCETGPSDVKKYNMEKDLLTDFPHILSYHSFPSTFRWQFWRFLFLSLKISNKMLPVNFPEVLPKDISGILKINKHFFWKYSLLLHSLKSWEPWKTWLNTQGLVSAIAYVVRESYDSDALSIVWSITESIHLCFLTAVQGAARSSSPAHAELPEAQLEKLQAG